MQKFNEILLGPMDGWEFLGYLAMALFGMYVSLLMHTTKRDVKSRRSPMQFSFAFLFSDNVKRITLSLCLVLIALRFTEELLQIELKPFIALFIGLGFDKLSQIIKDKTSLLDQKPTNG